MSFRSEPFHPYHRGRARADCTICRRNENPQTTDDYLLSDYDRQVLYGNGVEVVITDIPISYAASQSMIERIEEVERQRPTMRLLNRIDRFPQFHWNPRSSRPFLIKDLGAKRRLWDLGY